MESKANLYIPQVFRSFQGFDIKDIKEWRNERRMELILESEPEREHFCSRCGCDLCAMDGRYWLKSHHYAGDELDCGCMLLEREALLSRLQ